MSSVDRFTITAHGHADTETAPTLRSAFAVAARMSMRRGVEVTVVDTRARKGRGGKWVMKPDGEYEEMSA